MAALRYPFTVYLLDTSVINRYSGSPKVRAAVDPILDAAAAATCPPVMLEAGYSARSMHEFQRIRAWLDRMLLLTGDDEAMLAAMDAHRLLARRGQHRTPPVDLLIAATAAVHDAVVVHYDKDFERLAEVLDVRHRWVAPPGSLD